jgi:hypothetical protein
MAREGAGALGEKDGSPDQPLINIFASPGKAMIPRDSAIREDAR